MNWRGFYFGMIALFLGFIFAILPAVVSHWVLVIALWGAGLVMMWAVLMDAWDVWNGK